MEAIKATKGEITRNHILDVAYHLFLDNGYSATSMRDIVAASGITMGGIYTHFQSKEEIFAGVFEKENPIYKVFPAINQAEGNTLEDYVYNMAARMVDTLGTEREALNLMFIEIVEFKGSHYETAATKMMPQVVNLVARFHTLSSDLRPIPLPTLIRSFIGLFFSYFMTSIMLPSQFAGGDEALNEFVNIYLYGILKRDTAARS
jgi:AcrR family transcriptional regulator